MALTNTKLTAAIGASDLTIQVNDSSAALANTPIKIENEFARIVSTTTSGFLTLRARGDQGTAAVAHNKLVNVEICATAADFQTPAAGTVPILPPIPQLVSYSTSGAIAVPTVDTNIVLTSTSAAQAMTLVAPSAASDGVKLYITSQSSMAHTVTATSLIQGYSSGQSTATFNTVIGQGLVLMVDNANYNVLSANPNIVWS